MATACVIRGIESVEPLSSKFALSLANLVLSSIAFIVMKLRGKGTFYMPWYRCLQNQNGLKLYKFDARILTVLILGGMSEFLTSIMVLLGFSYSLKANLNQGIGSSLITLNSVFVTVFAYWLYKEKINLV